MVNLLDAKILGMDDDLPDLSDFENRVFNDIARFIAQYGKKPRYLYVNERTWGLCMVNLLSWTEPMGIEVIPNKFQHPRTAFVNYNQYPYRDIAAMSDRLMADEEDSILSGKLQIL